MEFERTPDGRREDPPVPSPIASLLDTELPGSGTPATDAHGPGIATRHQKAMIAAALFDEAPTPIKIGRFTIVRELGAGGMGVVYVAYDEQLDRRVAVKLLRGSASDVEAKARLQREAQAMARLSHPNVVTVHEVGTFQDQVFVAMEFVEGQDLRSWMKTERGDWRSVLAMFAQAGEGLAAAHEAGIVHRDFKPDNALVGKDGRVRVADFGLAHAFDASLLDDATRSSSDASRGDSRVTVSEVDEESSGRLDVALTKTGAIMGTPAYMAPEQFEGARTDDRSDQFSFCVALWEALFGRRPFSGANLAALSCAVMDGTIDAPPAEANVPAWVHAVLLRGLSPAPERRWPSMRALLDALAKDPEIRRKRALRVGALISTTALVLVGLGWIAGTALAQTARQQYWNALTGQLLEIERERGLRQAGDDALRARDATRMSVYRSYRPKGGVVDHEDPTVAAALLREVEGSARESEAWVSAANETLGQDIAKHVLIGHSDSVDALVFSPGGEQLYSGSADGTVRRWELASGDSMVIVEHESDVTDIALDPSGGTLVTASTDHTVRAWAPGREVRVLTKHDDAVTGVAFSPDGRSVATSSADGTARLIEVETGATRFVARHVGVVNDAVFDAAGERLLTIGYDLVARVWRVSDGRLLHELRGHRAAIFLGQFATGDRVVTGSDDGTVRVWSLGSSDETGVVLTEHPGAVTALDVHGDRVLAAWEDGTVRVTEPGEVHELPAHTHNVFAADFDPTGTQVLTASFDNTARVIDAEGVGVPRVFLGSRASLYRQAIDAGGRWYATGCYDGTIRVWDLAAPVLETTLRGHAKAVYLVRVDPRGETLASVGRDGVVRLWDARDGRARAVLTGDEPLNAAKFSPNGGVLATGGREGGVALWDTAQGTMRALVGHEDAIWDLAFDAEGRRLASASLDRTARIWDVERGAELVVLRGHQDRVTGVDFEPGGERVVTVSHDATLRFWSTRDGALEATLGGHDAKIWMVTRSPDGELLATASDDHTARLWPSEDASQAIVLRGHQAPVWSVAFDPAGTRVVTASYDATARVWGVDGHLQRTLAGHAESLWTAQFLADGRVVTSSDDNTIRVWPLADSSRTIVLSGHGEGVTALVASPDGLRMYSASADQTAKIWRLDLLDADDERLHARLDAVTRFCLSAEQRVRELGEDVQEAELAARRCELGHARGD